MDVFLQNIFPERICEIKIRDPVWLPSSCLHDTSASCQLSCRAGWQHLTARRGELNKRFVGLIFKRLEQHRQTFKGSLLGGEEGVWAGGRWGERLLSSLCFSSTHSDEDGWPALSLSQGLRARWTRIFQRRQSQRHQGWFCKKWFHVQSVPNLNLF